MTMKVSSTKSIDMIPPANSAVTSYKCRRRPPQFDEHVDNESTLQASGLFFNGLAAGEELWFSLQTTCVCSLLLRFAVGYDLSVETISGLLLETPHERGRMDAQDLGGLRFIVSRSGEHFFDVIVLQLPQAQKQVSGKRIHIHQGRLRLCRFLVIANLFGKRGCINVAFRSQDHRSLDDVLQLSNISGPCIALQQLRGFRSESNEILVQLVIEPRHHIECQWEDVFWSFAQWRNGNRYNIQPVK